MKYYEIIHKDEKNNKEIMSCFSDKDCENKYGIRTSELYEGKVINDWNKDFTFYYNSKEGYKYVDYQSNNLGWFLISPKFTQIINSVGVKGIQFLPVIIKEVNTGEILEGFSVVNITRLTEALNLQNSVYSEIEARGKKYINVIKYALSKDKLNGLNFLRLKDHEFVTFVSDEIKIELEKNKITGCDFLEVKVV